MLSLCILELSVAVGASQPAHNVVSILILGRDVEQPIFNVETTLHPLDPRKCMLKHIFLQM